MNMKTVFITSFHILISRNILAAGIPRLLVAEGFRVVVLVPEYKLTYFRERFAGPNVLIEGIDANQPSRTRRGRHTRRGRR